MFKKFVSIMTCIIMALSPVAALAEEAAAPTPTPVEHTVYYTEAASTDSIEGWPTGPSIEGQAAVVVDLNDGAIIYEKNADTQLYPASITKVLTCLLAVENLKDSDTYAMSESAAHGIESGSSSIYADTGEVFTVEQQIMALMLESANEMALALAEQTSGSVKKFVELMNQRAREIGCENTHFNNPNGLPDPSHYTTASDMARIAAEAWKNSSFRKYVTTRYYEIPPTNVQTETRYLLNHHKMMPDNERQYDGVLGGKTGYTVLAGNTLITYVKRGYNYIAIVVLNSTGGAYSDTEALIEYYYSSFNRTKALDLSTLGSENMELIRNSEVLKYLLPLGNLYEISPICVTLPNGADLSKVERIVIPNYNIMGDRSYRNEFYYEGQLVGCGNLYEHETLSSLMP